MSLRAQVHLWMRRRAKIWLFRLLVFSVVVTTSMSKVPAFKQWALTTDILLLMVVGLLYILFDVFLETLGQVDTDRSDGVLYAWNDAVPLMRKEVQKAKTVLILARSGEMAYHALRDLLTERTDKISPYVYMVRVPTDDSDFESYQMRWRLKWLSLGPFVKSVELVNAGGKIGLGAVIIDGSVGYLGYAKHPVFHPGGRPSLRISNKTQPGVFLLDHYREWITHHIVAEVKDSVEAGSERHISFTPDTE